MKCKVKLCKRSARWTCRVCGRETCENHCGRKDPAKHTAVCGSCSIKTARTVLGGSALDIFGGGQLGWNR